MRQIPFSHYTAGTWDAVVTACEFKPGCIDTVTHLDGAGRIVQGPSKVQLGDLIVIADDTGLNDDVILWMDYNGELVQLIKS